MREFEGAETIDEAVSQFYENPNKYSQSLGPGAPNDSQPASKETRTQVDEPPMYTPQASTMRESRHKPHTNAVIEAGKVRARDEVLATPL